MNCKKCNQAIPDNASFCGYCGASLKPAPSEPVEPAKAQNQPPQETLPDSASKETPPLPEEIRIPPAATLPIIETQPVDLGPRGEISPPIADPGNQNSLKEKRNKRLWLFLLIPVGCLVMAGIAFVLIIGINPILRKLPENWVAKPLWRTRIQESFDDPETSILPLDEDREIANGEYYWQMVGGGFSMLDLPYVPTATPFWLQIGWRFVSTDLYVSSWGVTLSAVNEDQTEYDLYQIVLYPDYYFVYLTDQDGNSQTLVEQPIELKNSANTLRVSAVPVNCLVIEINDEPTDCLYLDTSRTLYGISMSLFNETEIALDFIYLQDEK